MEEILHQLIGRISHDLQGPRFLSSQVIQDFFHQKYDKILWYAAQKASITSYILMMPVLTSPNLAHHSGASIDIESQQKTSPNGWVFGRRLSPLLLLVLEAGVISSIWILTTSAVASGEQGGVQGALLLSCVHFARNQAFCSSQIQISKPICPPKVLSDGFLHAAQKKIHHPLGGKKMVWTRTDATLLWALKEVLMRPDVCPIWTSIAPKDHQFPAPHTQCLRTALRDTWFEPRLQEADCWRNGGNTVSLQLVGHL